MRKRSACGRFPIIWGVFSLQFYMPSEALHGKAADCACAERWDRQQGLKRVLSEKKLLLVLDLDHTLLNSTRFEEVSLACIYS